MHHVEGFLALGAGVVAQQEIQGHRPGKLGRFAEARMARIEGAAEDVESGIQRSLSGRNTEPARGGHGRLFGQLLDGRAAGFHDAARSCAPGFRNALQHPWETGMAVALLGREIRAAVERLQLGREPNGHGPASAAGGGLYECHVNAIYVGPLFAIHLDGHEMPVHQRGDGFVLERFALHHVAPMAGGIADGKEDRLSLPARFFERLRPPREPVHGIVCVLE